MPSRPQIYGWWAKYKDHNGQFALETRDALLIVPDRMALLDFDNQIPDMAGGRHVNLFNNTWRNN